MCTIILKRYSPPIFADWWAVPYLFALVPQPMLRRAVHIFLLNRHRCYVPHIDFMPDCGTSRTGITRTSYGTHLLDHLPTHRASLAGGEVAVVALLQVDTHLLGSLHLELVHGLPGLGNVDLVAVLACHRKSLLFRFFCGFVPQG